MVETKDPVKLKQDVPTDDRIVRVVLFSGGRGSRVLSQHLINHRKVDLTLAVNGYDDGASTGEVRRFLGDCLGPSDFRKNASRMARELNCCPAELIEILDIRLPKGCSDEDGRQVLNLLSGKAVETDSPWKQLIEARFSALEPETKLLLGEKIRHFSLELDLKQSPFSFSDCAIGNIVFAGCHLKSRRRFNDAIEDYCNMLGLPFGLIENVTNGANACLVATDLEGRLLTTEAEIVNSERRNHISEIYLIDRIFSVDEEAELASASREKIDRLIAERACTPLINPRLLRKIAEADLIIYSPGTQHSSLFPSYITPGLGEAIAANLTAVKLLITNLQEDAEIPDSSAVDIIERAVYYLKGRDTRPIPTPYLITHYLLNDHQQKQDEAPYVPLGRLESLEDPRLVRIGNYEEGSSGTHDAVKVIMPFISNILTGGNRRRIAVWLLDTDSLNKVSQTILEAVRAGIEELKCSFSFYYSSAETLDPEIEQLFPFTISNVDPTGRADTGAFRRSSAADEVDYVLLFDSSGMYRGEDIVNIASLLTNPRLDAVWGSRRLSIRDIRESYKLRYRHNRVLGAFSYLGSHLLSLSYLFRFGRYVSDSLSTVGAVRAEYILDRDISVEDACFSHRLLCALMAERAEVIETPVQFFPLSPEKARRTSLLDGIRALGIVLFGLGTASWIDPGSRRELRDENERQLYGYRGALLTKDK